MLRGKSGGKGCSKRVSRAFSRSASPCSAQPQSGAAHSARSEAGKARARSLLLAEAAVSYVGEVAGSGVIGKWRLTAGTEASAC